MRHNTHQQQLVHDFLHHSTGTPLARTVRTEMENRFGADFSHVRIHTGAVADMTTLAFNALAYTAGTNIVFRHNNYNPATAPGKRLLAHELAHVLQQQHGFHDNISPEALEYQAEVNADAVLSDSPLPTWNIDQLRPNTTHDANWQEIQCYKEEPNGNPTWWISQNDHYILEKIERKEPYTLWVKEQAKNPRRCVTILDATKPKNFPRTWTDYRGYELDGYFLADCLHSAEEVMFEKRLVPSGGKILGKKYDGHVVSKIAKCDTFAMIGITEKCTLCEALKYDKNWRKKELKELKELQERNMTEAPAVGQSFMIVRNEYKPPSRIYYSPYHAAAVVAVDGNDRITLETSAGNVHAKQGKGTRGIFDMYEIKPSTRKRRVGDATFISSHSFHARYGNKEPQGNYGPDAIVLTIEKIEEGEREKMGIYMKPGPTADTVPRTCEG